MPDTVDRIVGVKGKYSEEVCKMENCVNFTHDPDVEIEFPNKVFLTALCNYHVRSFWHLVKTGRGSVIVGFINRGELQGRWR